jgi:hypothetical protein
MKAVLPGSPQAIMESKQAPTPAEIPKVKEAVPAPLTDKKAAMIRAANKGQISQEVSAGVRAPKAEMQENKLAGASDKTMMMKSDSVIEKDGGKYTERPALQEAPQVYGVRQESARKQSLEDSSLSASAEKKKAFTAAAPAAQRSTGESPAAVQPCANIVLRVEDLNSAAKKVEEILIGYKARIKSKQLLERRLLMQAEVSGNVWKDVLSKLKEMGQVEEKVMPMDIGQRDITVVIEIEEQ